MLCGRKECTDEIVLLVINKLSSYQTKRIYKGILNYRLRCAVLWTVPLPFVGLGWLRHCATSRRVPGTIPGHWGFFPEHETVPCSLGSTQPLKMSTRIFLGVKTAGA